MIGAVIFVVFFLLSFLVTLAFPDLPVAPWVLGYIGIPHVEYEIRGYPAWLLMRSIVNGVVYGFISWLIFSIANLAWRAVTERRRAGAPKAREHGAA